MITKQTNLQLNLDLLACLMLAVQEEERAFNCIALANKEMGFEKPKKLTWVIMAEVAIENALATSRRQTAIYGQLTAFVGKVAELGMSYGDSDSPESIALFQLWQEAEDLLKQINQP